MVKFALRNLWMAPRWIPERIWINIHAYQIYFILNIRLFQVRISNGIQNVAFILNTGLQMSCFRMVIRIPKIMKCPLPDFKMSVIWFSGEEKQINPFMRVSHLTVREFAGKLVTTFAFFIEWVFKFLFYVFQLWIASLFFENSPLCQLFVNEPMTNFPKVFASTLNWISIFWTNMTNTCQSEANY